MGTPPYHLLLRTVPATTPGSTNPEVWLAIRAPDDPLNPIPGHAHYALMIEPDAPLPVSTPFSDTIILYGEPEASAGVVANPPAGQCGPQTFLGITPTVTQEFSVNILAEPECPGESFTPMFGLIPQRGDRLIVQPGDSRRGGVQTNSGFRSSRL